ncbi:dTDP-4-dehydrorhamnose reductase [Castellaniella sp.]|uniref:dTDP-4-dehydrorhamnose reductase n=1 Tax=Castellaniella sp. TaxID=1955812 RepID=UPI002AFF26B6|nr:dTDP-4-dehydrorhamnose reductase [Castellaniella sp.]
MPAAMAPCGPRILVTGADGQLGRSLQALAAQDRSPAAYLFVSRAELDITDAAALDRWLDAHPVDYLINAAAYTAVDRAATDMDTAMAVNARAPGLLARCCAARSARLLHVSTDYVFDGALDRAYRESDAHNPLNTYGRSKLLGEQAALAAAPDTIIVRTSWVFSVWGGNFVRTMLRLGAQHDHLRVIHDQTGGPTWAGHLAGVLHRLVLQSHGAAPNDLQMATGAPSSRIPGGVYHFSGSPWVSWHGFAQEIFTQALDLGLIPRLPTVEAIRSQDWPSPEPRPANSRLDCARLETLLGPLERDWRAGLAEVLRTWRDAPVGPL